jgi:hypothetical protein
MPYIYKMSNAGGMSTLTRYTDMLAGNAAWIDPAYESISTVTVGAGGVSTVTFSSIPATYQHLQIRYFAQSNRGTYSIDNIQYQFNGDTGSNYTLHYLQGAVASPGTTALSGASVAQTGIRNDICGTTTGGQFGAGVVDILDYTNTNKNKVTRHLTGLDTNGFTSGFAGTVMLNSGLWTNTSAITSIKLNPQVGTAFTQYSSFALYGIKG